ncbi:MAG: hypothetical protein PHE83_10275 [Opitutaceae bacterium]|nr:hypothetical protein [Opitutaceae bacterium]
MTEFTPLYRDQRKIDADHLQLLTVFHFIGAALGVVGILFVVGHYTLMSTVFLNPKMWAGQKQGPPPAEVFAIFKWFYVIMALWFILSGVANLISGYYIRARKRRIFSILVAGLNLLHMPLGTMLGAFTLVVLLRDSVREAYEAQASAGPPPRGSSPPLTATPVNASVSEAPPPLSPAPARVVDHRGDATGGIIPYKNPHALTAYYLGVFSVIPGLGFFSGVAAVVLGVSGLKKRARDPVIRGSVHAWIGIVCGSLSVAVHVLLVVLLVIAALRHH